MKIKQIDHFVITTRSLAESLHFYVDILGMEHDGEGWASFLEVRFAED
jgi:catechol 2,3-dioxygenase-like lactoylglutathione lyase family enzyme